MQFQWAFKFILFLLESMLVHEFAEVRRNHFREIDCVSVSACSFKWAFWSWVIEFGPPLSHHITIWKDYLVSGAAGYVSFCQGAPDNVLDGILDAFFHIWLHVFAGSRSWQTDTDDPSLEGPSLVGTLLAALVVASTSTSPTIGGYYHLFGKGC